MERIEGRCARPFAMLEAAPYQGGGHRIRRFFSAVVAELVDAQR